jgi:hypothetical protein
MAKSLAVWVSNLPTGRRKHMARWAGWKPAPHRPVAFPVNRIENRSNLLIGDKILHSIALEEILIDSQRNGKEEFALRFGAL